MASVRYRSYSDFLDTLGGLINWSSYTAVPATQKTALKQYYNNASDNGWIASNWLAVCPNGEARFVGNQGQYPNNLSVTTYWTATATTVTKNSIANPADGRVTASRLLETTANSEHKVLQSLTFLPNATYQLTCYARPIGGRYLYLTANDGANTYSAFFDVVNGTVGATSATCTSPATISQFANGFWVCNIFFTSASTAGAGTYGPAMSTDGSTISYVGDAAKGLYVWGNVLTQTTYSTPTTLLISNDQLGEEFIDAVFQVYQTNPVGAGYPVPQGFEMMPDGIQIIGTNAWVWNGWLWTFPTWYTAGYPLYLYYRKGKPSYSGADYSAIATYAVGQQILFTDSSGVMNFWKCIVATTAGQSPDTTPNSWEILLLPEFLFQYVVYASYADYLRMDAQFEKASGADALSQAELDRAHDREERQMGIQLPFRVQTHVSNQARGWPGY
jgi:hypothetical protein